MVGTMPTLDFKGKAFIYTHHLAVPFRELVVDAHKSETAPGGSPALGDNLIIQGDNLEALKALLPMYAGKVDCIYIDPPYNTGNEGWCYNDKVNSPLMREWLKKSANPVDKEDLERHDKWLCMMWPRLQLLKELLAEDGAIFVSIGDDEEHRLRGLLDEIFLENRFVAEFVWKSRAKPSNIGERKKKPQKVSEYVLCYTKEGDGEKKIFGLLESGEDRTYPHKLEGRNYRLQTILKSNRGDNQRETMRFELAGYTPPPGQRWQGGEKHIHKLHEKGRIEFRDGIPFLRYFEGEEDPEHTPLYTFIPPSISGTAEKGKIELNQILGDDHGLDTVKPLSLMQWILSFATDEDSIVLDSFAGSGTTAHAVLALNKKDDGSRKFILVETEDYADTLTAERVRRVARGYEFEGTQREELYRRDLNFTAFKKAGEILDSIEGIENLERDRFDRITKTVQDDTLLVVGERKVAERTEGLGGTFTYCTLGAELSLDALFGGDGVPGEEAAARAMPGYAAMARHIFYTATGRTLLAAPTEEDAATDGHIGETELYRVHLHYRPDPAWLRSNAAALTEAMVDRLRAGPEAAGKRTLVFAAAKFLGQKELTRRGVEFCQLPYSIHRLLGGE